MIRRDIIAGIIIIIAMLGFVVGLSLVRKKESRDLDCSSYKSYPIQSLPIGCYKYYGIEGGGVK